MKNSFPKEFIPSITPTILFLYRIGVQIIDFVLNPELLSERAVHRESLATSSTIKDLLYDAHQPAIPSPFLSRIVFKSSDFSPIVTSK